MADEKKRNESGGPAPDERGRPIDWKLLFNQLFALEIKKEYVISAGREDSAEFLDRLLRAYTQYSPGTFNDALDEISSVESSDDAYEARLGFYENPIHRRLISDLELSRCVGDEVAELKGVQRFLEVIRRHKDRPVAEDESFLASPEGRNMIDAFRVDDDDNDQEVAFVLVPGYAAHTIKYVLFEEMVKDVNSFYGRPPERSLLKEDGIDLEFEDHETYYSRGEAQAIPFDILQPAGKELGNTTGFNTETTDLLRKWVDTLPERYANKKLIFFGYSKGASIMLDLVKRHPDLSDRVLGFVTFSGVVQGTHVARLALDEADRFLREVPLGNFVERLRKEDAAELGSVISPLFAELDLSWLSVPRIRAVFDILGYDITPLEKQIDHALESREVHELLDGARDLTPSERIRWNLEHLDNETFRSPAYIFNISALTDVKDFVRPIGLRSEGSEGRSLLAPVLNSEGTLDWKQLSLDALFLYVTSIDGFKNAPGGLFDTQVELGNTKTPLIDRRPLSASLTDEELAALWEDEALRGQMKRNGIRSLEQLANTPRRDLIPTERCDNIDAIDLGEFKGHHWSPFIQALRPPPELSEEHAVWDFPRKAFMRALLQVLAFHNLVQHRFHGDEAEVGADEKGRDEPSPNKHAKDPFRDVVLFRSEGEEEVRRLLTNIYNLVVKAATYGVVVNSARTGLGTSPPMGKVLATESLYYQALRVFSYADLELRNGILRDPSVWPLPRSLALIVGRFPKDYADSCPEESIERLDEVRRALKVLAPRLPTFELRRLGLGDYAMRTGSRSVTFSPPIRENLWAGTKAKLASIERDAYGTETTNVEAKLEAMLGAFTPLCTVFSAAFDPGAPEQSVTRLTVYLPAYHTLHADDFDHPKRWHLEKGLHNLRLPRPVQLSTAEITHIRYLAEADTEKSQAIKLEVRRDFRGRDRVSIVASFGKLFDGSADELYAFDTSDHRDALHVIFRPRFAPEKGDTPADRAFKEGFNRVFSNFEIEARIHQVTLHMRRRPHGATAAWEDDAVLRPRFSLEESRISFRVHRYIDTAVERLPLQATGFTCEEDPEGKHRFHCVRDFWTWDHLRDEFFYGRTPGSDRPKLPTHLRQRLLEQLIGSATQAVVDRSIESIEDAIDEEIGRVVDDYLKRYSKARKVLIERLHDGLF